MLNLIPLLTGAGTVSFDLVIPSLPGFGFSAKPASPGVNTALLAGLWVKLMSRLGYPRFIAQGGDFGAMVSTHIALNHPDSLIGLHLNYIPFNYQPFLPAGEKLTAEETAAQQKTIPVLSVRRRLRIDTGHQTPDTCLRVERFAGRLVRLDLAAL
jgi:pimeloyl-ACP methyl ester carboxylesterase